MKELNEESASETLTVEQTSQSVEESTVTENSQSTSKPLGRLNKFYGISAKGSSVKVEILAGVATFLAMCYILIVNPTQIIGGAGLDTTNMAMWSSVFIATALGAVIGTLLMSLLAKMPYAQAPGMGLNSTVGSLFGGYAGYSMALGYGSIMLLVLISGVIFLLLSVIPCGRNKETGEIRTIRELIFDGIPKTLRTAIPVGIGLFIAYIGLQNAGVIVHNPFTQIGLVGFNGDSTTIVNVGAGVPITGTIWGAAICLITLVVIAVCSHFKIKGAVIYGILVGTLIGIPTGVTNIDYITGSEAGVTWKFWENFSNLFSFNSNEGGIFLSAFSEGFSGFNGLPFFSALMLVISFCMIDMFDTMGTVTGCATRAGLLDKDGKPLNYGKCMYSDSIATVAGALLGTSTVTTFVESGTGIAVGGKTGLTSLTTAIMFFLSIFLLPIFACIPSAAAAGALVYVGVLMMGGVKNIDFTTVKEAVPAFITIIIMPLAYSITAGIGMGMLFYVAISLLCYVVDIIKYVFTKKNGCEKPKFEIPLITIIVAVLFVLYFFLPTQL